ncbi:type ISP restriction/modification enzyme [Kocuria salsicia]|uniref:Type ISP restriction/modification enzyme n=1 Tax=Kocuria salsicia TaxID=664639 RepID=A0ABV3KEI4_9MICC
MLCWEIRTKYNIGKNKIEFAYNQWTALECIPPEVHTCIFGSQSRIDWLVDRSEVKNNKNRGPVKDPKGWFIRYRDPRCHKLN